METNSKSGALKVTSSPFSEGLGPALLYFAFRGGAWIAEHAPMWLGDWVARVGSRLALRFLRRKRQNVTRNLARVVGEGPHLRDTVRAAFDSYAKYWLETFRLGRYSREDLLEMVECRSTDVIERSLASGRGAVLATAHFGFYDLGVAWTGVKGYGLATVAEVLRPRALFEWFASVRERGGMEVLPAKPRDQTRSRMFKILEEGRGIALLNDRDLGRRGVWVELFGEKTTFPVSPSLLIARTGAILLAAAIYETGPHRFRIDFEEVPYKLSGNESDDIGAIAQVIAGAVEGIVRKAPAQWHLFSTNWPSDEPGLSPRGGAP